jgi:hypothetical protein
MILPFSTQLNGKPTYFVERIHQSLKSPHFNDTVGFSSIHVPKGFDFVMYRLLRPKHHTIRDDKNERWKVGTKIDFFINCRQPNMFRFAPVLPVVSTQKIFITYTKTKKAMVFIDDKCFYMQDFSLEHNHKMLHLSQNDGFDTIEDFFAYFDKDFTGKIIHWTDLKY